MANESPKPMDVVLLGSLYRRPMHGYQLKLELRYKHVDLWAKCNHGHIYYTLKRLERDGRVESYPDRAQTEGPPRRVFEITDAGRKHLLEALRLFGSALEETYFDVDLFLANAWVLPKDEVLEILTERGRQIEERLRTMRGVQERMTGRMPKIAELMLEHRLSFLQAQHEFVRKACGVVQEETTWGSYFGSQDIEDVASERGVDLDTEEE
jgi:DNA-binding PadR family transcriptional regulator